MGKGTQQENPPQSPLEEAQGHKDKHLGRNSWRRSEHAQKAFSSPESVGLTPKEATSPTFPSPGGRSPPARALFISFL